MIFSSWFPKAGARPDGSVVLDNTNRSQFLLLQILVTIVLAYQLLFSQSTLLPLESRMLIILGLMSMNVVLMLLPIRMWESGWTIGALTFGDTAIVTAIIYLSGDAGSDLFLIYFLIMLIAAFTPSLNQMLGLSVILCAAYGVILYVGTGQEGLLTEGQLLRIPVLLILTVSYGVAVQAVRRERQQKVALLDNISALERAEKERDQIRKQQLQMKDQFLSHVSHELRTPLTAIYQFVTILLDRLAGDLNSEQHEYLEIVLRNVNQLRGMIGDLLEVTRSETGKLSIEPRSTSLGELIAEAISMFRQIAATKQVTLSAVVPSDLPPAYADPQRVRQILVNLLDNAIKFTVEHGTITVRANVFVEDPNLLCVAVSDTGRGISPEGVHRIFERLYQERNSDEASREGLGLGLYICKELVSRHGGRIWVESRLGHGSVFYFTLPIFSLVRLLRPVIAQDRKLTDSLALIAVEVSLLDQSASTTIAETRLQEVRNVLQRCIRPDGDLLLPKTVYTAKRAAFFIIACSERSGAEVIVRRIQKQLAQYESLDGGGLEPAVSFTMLDIASRRNNKPVEQVVKELAGSIEDLTTTAFSKRWGLL